MADENDTADKTEDPTQKRLDDAHERGDVAKSQEINTWFVIAAGTLVLSTFSGSIGGGIVMPLRNLVANSWMIHADGPGLMALAKSLEYVLIAVLGVPLLMLALAAIAGNMVQHRLLWSGEQLKPKLSKISPAAGAKRIFGKQAAANFGKGLFKVAALGAVMTAVLWPERHRLESMVRFDPAAVLGATTGLTLYLLGAVVAMLAVVAIADFFFQYRQWFERQKMSLQEMKEEFKQSEGDPHVKGRIRQLRQARMKKRTSRMCRWRGPCMPPWRSTTRSPWNTIMRSPRLSATSWVSSADCPAGGRDSVPARKCAGNERNQQKAGLTGLRSRARFRHSGEARETRVPSVSIGCVPSHDRRN